LDTTRSYTISHETEDVGDRTPLIYSDREKTEEEAYDFHGRITRRKGLRRILGWVKIPQAPFSFVEGATKDSK
jgi:hypothetical protein